VKFDGRQLFELGVPKDKIKFYIGKEFGSVEEILEDLKPKKSEKDRVYTWVDYLWEVITPKFLPMQMNGNLPVRASKSEIRRWLDSSSVEINGKFPTSKDECGDEEFPLTSLIFFPNGKRKTTMVGYSEKYKKEMEDESGLNFQDYLWWKNIFLTNQKSVVK
jgi:hypothetical protein